MSAPSSFGTIIGVGLGPGDRNLMSVRAHRLVSEAKHVAYFRKAGRIGRARKIVEGLLRPDATEIALEYPVTTEIAFDDPTYNALLATFYADAARRLRALAEAGHYVAVLCEGDPFFYGSFMHLYARLEGVVPVEVVPGITGMSAAWTASGIPMTWGDDVLTVLMGTMPEADLARRMADADALVVMKVGRNLPKVRRALETAGKAERAWLVECASMDHERVLPLAEAGDRTVPYFSIVLVHGSGRRP
jgi:precorrin-2/cobalt-factor-2 C20-methyltransferase